MSDARSNSTHLPPGLTEELLVDYVDGVLGPAESARVAGLVASDARLRALVAGMASDKAALARAPEPRPPADLLERVQAVLEREALLGLSEGERGTPRLRIATSDGPALSSRLGEAWARAWRPLALAAGLALVASGGVYWARIFAASAPGPKPEALVARGPEDASTGPVANIAAVDEPPAVAKLAVASEAVAQASLMQAEAPPPAGVDAARGAELLRAGRLVIRVETGEEPGPMLPGISRRGPVMAMAGPSRALNASPRVPMRPDWSEPRVELAGLSLSGPVAGPPLPRASVRRVVVRVADSPAALEALRASLERRYGGRVVFEESAGPAAPALDAADLVWWSGPSSGWSRRLPAPVDVIER